MLEHAAGTARELGMKRLEEKAREFLAESSPDFEETALALAELARSGDPRLGVEPGARGPRRARRAARRRPKG